jgi:hypothetical protein
MLPSPPSVVLASKPWMTSHGFTCANQRIVKHMKIIGMIVLMEHMKSYLVLQI